VSFAFELAFEPATMSSNHPSSRKNGRGFDYSPPVTSSLPPSTRSAGMWVTGLSSLPVARPSPFPNQLLLRKDNDENQGGPGTIRE